jgi:ABC-type molybdenum transport system ATPase subunit/photorepair protein PhrA
VGVPTRARAILARVAMAPDERSASSPALRFADVELDREATPVLRGVNWQVSAGERWAVIGPNGSGKTTLMQLASGYLHPTRGTVEVLGQRLGRTDVRALRKRVSTVSASVARVIVPWLTAKEVVVSARQGALVAYLQRSGVVAGRRTARNRGLRPHCRAPFWRALGGRAPTGVARSGPHD